MSKFFKDEPPHPKAYHHDVCLRVHPKTFKLAQHKCTHWLTVTVDVFELVKDPMKCRTVVQKKPIPITIKLHTTKKHKFEAVFIRSEDWDRVFKEWKVPKIAWTNLMRFEHDDYTYLQLSALEEQLERYAFENPETLQAVIERYFVENPETIKNIRIEAFVGMPRKCVIKAIVNGFEKEHFEEPSKDGFFWLNWPRTCFVSPPEFRFYNYSHFEILDSTEYYDLYPVSDTKPDSLKPFEPKESLNEQDSWKCNECLEMENGELTLKCGHWKFNSAFWIKNNYYCQRSTFRKGVKSTINPLTIGGYPIIDCMFHSNGSEYIPELKSDFQFVHEEDWRNLFLNLPPPAFVGPHFKKFRELNQMTAQTRAWFDYLGRNFYKIRDFLEWKTSHKFTSFENMLLSGLLLCPHFDKIETSFKKFVIEVSDKSLVSTVEGRDEEVVDEPHQKRLDEEERIKYMRYKFHSNIVGIGILPEMCLEYPIEFESLEEYYKSLGLL